jgi:hypothetical protein
VAWHSGKADLDYVQLGPDEFVEPRLGAHDLLGELLRLNLEKISAGKPPTDGSARVRFERAGALARALGLGSVDDVVHGRFLTGELAAGQQGVLDELAARSQDPDPREDSYAASAVFTHLLFYRRDVERVVRATAGWMMCSDPALLGMIATQNRIAGELVAVMRVDVERWLCALMAPTDQRFTLRELIAHHAWPDVDLYSIERDEM